jgi:AraC-like DNA-binding protein
VVHAFQALAANDDRRHSELLGQIQNLHVQLTSLARRVELIERHLADADDADTALAARLVELERQLGEARPA